MKWEDLMAIGVEELIARLGSGIESTPGVGGGEPRIAGTRIPVWALEQGRRLGASEADLLRDYPELRAADLVNAWTYVAAHRDEIEMQIRENEAEVPAVLPLTGVAASPVPPAVVRSYLGFDREETAYARLKPELLRSAEGKYVVLVGEELVGPVDTYGDALRAGYRRFGKGPLFVKRVLAEEPVDEVSRDITLCRP
jgi:uncharacterized protein (DUF433 family)